MTKQIEAATCSNRVRVQSVINSIFHKLPERFKASDLESLCKFKSSPQHRMLVASVLVSVFKCSQVGYGNTRLWKKTT